jgi:hypothetical protein
VRSAGRIRTAGRSSSGLRRASARMTRWRSSRPAAPWRSPASSTRTSRGRQHEEAAPDLRGEGEDRSPRRSPARGAARRGLPGRGLVPGRAGQGAEALGCAPGAAGASAQPREERDSRGRCPLPPCRWTARFGRTLTVRRPTVHAAFAFRHETAGITEFEVIVGTGSLASLFGRAATPAGATGRTTTPS